MQFEGMSESDPGPTDADGGNANPDPDVVGRSAVTHRKGSPIQRWPGRLRKLAAEPLVHFIIIGFVLFAVGRIYQRNADVHRIVITPAHVAQLANDYALQFGERPDPHTLQGLIDQDVRDEILFRQGLALKLDVGDEIVHRRVVQKEQFLLQDLNPPAEPSEPQLAAFYTSHAERYATLPRTTFSHIYFSSDKGDAPAKARADAVLKTLSPTVTRAPDKGDPFPDLYDFSAYEPEQIYRLFGHTAFATAVLTAPPGHWGGPYRSAYGWHLLYVDARQAASHPALSDVRDAVRADYIQAHQDAANQAAFDRLAKTFTVIRKDRAR